MTTLRLTLNLFGKFSITAAYAVIDTYGSEVIPTEVRAAGYGAVGAASRVSSLASTLAGPLLKKYPPLFVCLHYTRVPSFVFLLAVFSRGHATQHLALLVGRSAGRSVCRSPF